ncbi:tyrosine-protein phosphatase [Asanoa sp. NPDC049573]|uniref:tyrosine-protein phosphatase n=1 Tax=Asanoa sp. NPDC049573 TaxID=3155396 RepID=UPI00342C0D12
MRHLPFERLHNFRDVGGYSTSDGSTVQWRRLYRSDGLGKLAGADWVAFQALGVRTVIDLRNPEEIARRGRVPDHPGLAYHNLSIEHRPFKQATLAPDVEPVRFLADRNAEVLVDGAAEIAQALAVIALAENTPVVIHCAAGKDRTGLLAALVLSLVGVGDEDIVADYALTGLAAEKFVADWHANPANPRITWPAYGHAPAEAMRLTLKELAATHGSVHDYARDRLGVDDALLVALRATLLDP